MEEDTRTGTSVNSLGRVASVGLDIDQEFNRNDEHMAEKHVSIDNINVCMNVTSEALSTNDDSSDDSKEKNFELLATDDNVISQAVGISDIEMMEIIDKLSKDEDSENNSDLCSLEDVKELGKSVAHDKNIVVDNFTADVSVDEYDSDQSKSSSNSDDSKSNSEDENVYICTDSDVSGDEEVIKAWRPSDFFCETQNGINENELCEDVQSHDDLEDEMIITDVLSGYEYNYGDFAGQDTDTKGEGELNELRADVKDLIKEMDNLSKKGMEDDVGANFYVKPVKYSDADTLVYNSCNTPKKTHKVYANNVHSHVKFHSPTNTILYDPESPVVERVCVEVANKLNDYGDEHEDSYNVKKEQENFMQELPIAKETMIILDDLGVKADNLKHMCQEIQTEGAVSVDSEKTKNLELIQKHGFEFSNSTIKKVDSGDKIIYKNDNEHDKQSHAASIYDDIIGMHGGKKYKPDEMELGHIDQDLSIQQRLKYENFDNVEMKNSEKERNEVADNVCFEDRQKETLYGAKDFKNVEDLMELNMNEIKAKNSIGKEVVRKLVLGKMPSQHDVNEKLYVENIQFENDFEVIGDYEQSVVGDNFYENNLPKLQNETEEKEMKNVEPEPMEASENCFLQHTVNEMKFASLEREEHSNDIKCINPEIWVSPEGVIKVLGVEGTLNFEEVECEATKYKIDKADVNLTEHETDMSLNEPVIEVECHLEVQSNHVSELNFQEVEYKTEYKIDKAEVNEAETSLNEPVIGVEYHLEVQSNHVSDINFQEVKCEAIKGQIDKAEANLTENEAETSLNEPLIGVECHLEVQPNHENELNFQEVEYEAIKCKIDKAEANLTENEAETSLNEPVIGVECHLEAQSNHVNELNFQAVECEAIYKIEKTEVNETENEAETSLNEPVTGVEHQLEVQSKELNSNDQCVLTVEPSHDNIKGISDTSITVKDSKMEPTKDDPDINALKKPDLKIRESKTTVSSASKLAQMVLSEVLDLIYWRDVKKTGVVFGSMVLLILALTFFTLLSVVAYLCIAVLTVTLSYRVYKNVMQAIQKTNEGHPFRNLLEMDIELKEDVVQSVGEKVSANINNCLQVMRRLFLVENYVDSLKFGLLMWLLTFIGCWFSGMTLVTLVVVAILTLPKLYDTYKGPIDQNVNLVHGQLNKIIEQISAKIPFLKKQKTQ